MSLKTRSKDENDDITSTDVYSPGAYLIQPGGAVHSEVNAGQDELVALVYFDGPVDFVLAK